MDTQSVELALDELGIPLPAHAKRTRATLDKLAQRHAKLRALHRNLIADQVANTGALIIFGDTQVSPPPAEWPSNRQAARAVGPTDLLARVRWLADPKNQSWIPSAAELND